jgi:hypothetical protein
MDEILVWAVFLALPAVGVMPALLLRRRHRRRWTTVFVWAAVAIAAVYCTLLLFGAVTGNVCWGDCYAEPAAERAAGAIMFWAAFLLVVTGLAGLVAIAGTSGVRRTHRRDVP